MPQFLSKHEISLQQPKAPTKAENLAGDLLGIMESSTQALNTYNTIGATAAKIQFQEDSNIASQKLTVLKESLIEARYANDTARIKELEGDVKYVTSDLVSKADRFKNHTAAYDAYRSNALEFSTNIQSTWNPMIAEAYFSVSKENQTIRNKRDNENKVMLGVSITDEDVALQDDVSKPLNIDTASTASDAFNVNHDITVANISKNISQFVDKHKLFKQTEDGNTIYDFEAESQMVATMYGGRYFVDKNTGQVESYSRYATAEEKSKISGLLGKMREQLMDGEGNAKNPIFDALMKEIEPIVSASGGNSAKVESNKQYQQLMSIPDSSLSKEQRYRKAVLGYSIGINKEKAKDVASGVDYLLSTKDATSLAIAMQNGLGGMSASEVRAEVTRRGGILNASVNQAILSGSENLEAIYQNALEQSFVLGVKLDATNESADIASGAKQAISTKQMESALAIENAKLNVGNLAGTGYSSSIELEYKKKTIETKRMQIASKRQELINQGYKPNEVEKELKLFINSINAKGVQDKDTSIKTNMYYISNISTNDTNRVLNLGSTTLSLTNSQKKFLSIATANAGVTFGSSKEATEWIVDNLYRKSEMFGTAQYIPATMTEYSFEMVRESAYKKAGIPYNETTKKYIMFLAPEFSTDGTKTYVTPTVYPTDGKPIIVNQPYDVAKLSQLKKPTVFVKSSDVSATNIKTAAQQSEELARKGLIKYNVTPTNKKATGAK